jgi:proline iminopeptidase
MVQHASGEGEQMPQEAFVTSNGARLWTISQGAGVPVVLCSGGPGMADYLAPVAGMIDDIAQAIRFDARGCGRSDIIGPYDIQTCLDDLEAIRRYYGIARWIVGGHSFGADFALLYAIAQPQATAGLICLAGGRVANDREWHSAYEHGLTTIGEVVPATDYPPNLEMNSLYNQDWKRVIQRPTLLHEIAHIQAPALFLYGADDIRPSWPVEQVARLMLYARYIELPQSPHVLWHTQSDLVRDHLRAFFDDQKNISNTSD